MKQIRLSRHQINLPLVTQKTSCHCGPAVVEMMLHHVGVKTTQDEVVKAGRVQKRIKEYGMRPDMMVTALKSMAPNHTLLFKQHATLRDIASLIETYHYPVGVNWQGLFYQSVREEKKKDSHGDHGHYSVIVDINGKHSQIAVLDPYRDFATGARIFSYRWFLKRWWDFVAEPDKATGKEKKVNTHRFLFVIVPKNIVFPEKLGLRPGKELSAIFA